MNSSRMHDEAVLSAVSVVRKSVLYRVEVHEREACTIRETIALVAVSLEDPPSLPLNRRLYPQNSHHTRSLYIFSKGDSDGQPAPLFQKRKSLVSHVILKRGRVWPQRAFQGRIYGSDNSGSSFSEPRATVSEHSQSPQTSSSVSPSSTDPAASTTSQS